MPKHIINRNSAQYIAGGALASALPLIFVDAPKDEKGYTPSLMIDFLSFMEHSAENAEQLAALLKGVLEADEKGCRIDIDTTAPDFTKIRETENGNRQVWVTLTAINDLTILPIERKVPEGVSEASKNFLQSILEANQKRRAEQKAKALPAC